MRGRNLFQRRMQGLSFGRGLCQGQIDEVVGEGLALDRSHSSFGWQLLDPISLGSSCGDLQISANQRDESLGAMRGD